MEKNESLRAVPQENDFRATPSRASQNALLKNEIYIGAITDVCAEKDMRMQENEYNK